MATSTADLGAGGTGGGDAYAPIGVYVHIPFCRAKCAYCDFASFTGLDALHGRYVTALLREAEVAAAAWDAPRADTLFLGGGTPTVLPVADLVRILRVCRRQFSLTEEAEVSLEANPGTVTRADLTALRVAGFNRLSLGVQSLRADELALLGRIHSAGEAEEAVRWARDAGFRNVNLDLIYGLPRQTAAQWRESLLRALALAPEHLSLYALQVEEGTPLADCIARGTVPAPDDDAAADMYELAEEILDAAGYAHYEISNWARRGPADPSPDLPSLACRHNLKYWRNLRYLGLGSAAHSYDGRCRRGNTPSPREYVEHIEAGRSPVVEEECPQAAAEAVARDMDETMMLGLRLIAGVSFEGFRRRFGVALEQVYRAEIAELVEDGLLERREDGIRLTPRGRLLGNRVFAAFLRDTGEGRR